MGAWALKVEKTLANKGEIVFTSRCGVVINLTLFVKYRA
jgi:hypothetical protein